MKQDETEAERIQHLRAAGKRLYGTTAFRMILDSTSALRPFMDGDVLANSLEELVKPLDPSIIRESAHASGVLVSAVNSTLFDAQHFKHVGYTLAGLLATTAQRAQLQAAKPNPPRFHMSQASVMCLLMEALQQHSLVQLAEPVSLDWPPGGEAGIYGRRVWTGETERPGSNHGYDPLSRPPT